MSLEQLTVQHKPEFIYFSDKIIPLRRILLITVEEEVASFSIDMTLDDATNRDYCELFQTKGERDKRFDEIRKLLTGS